MRVNKTQRGIAACSVGCNHAQRAQVQHLVEAKRFAAHFLDNAVDVFGPALHQRCNAGPI